MKLQPLADRLAQLVRQDSIRLAARGVEQAERCALALKRVRHGDERRDADAPGQKQIGGPGGRQGKMVVRPLTRRCAPASSAPMWREPPRLSAKRLTAMRQTPSSQGPTTE